MAKPAAPAFEVVEDEPAPAKAATASKSTPKPAADEEPDFEVVDEPKAKKKVVVEDDDDDDRPRRKRKNRDDDDDDDRPRSKRRRYDDDDDDDDDRQRKKKKRRTYDDEDDDWAPRRSGSSLGKAKVGAILLTISGWTYFGLYCLLTLGVLLVWFGSGIGSSSTSTRSGSSTGDSDWLFLLFGFIGAANWIVSIVGFSFFIAGARKARTMAITATSVAGVHLVLVAICFSMASDALAGLSRLGGFGSGQWAVVPTTFPGLNVFLPMLFYASKSIDGDFMVVMFTGAAEVARAIFLLLAVRAIANEAKDTDTAERSQVGVIVVSVVMGGSLLFSLLIAVMLREGNFTSFSTIKHLVMGSLFLIFVAYTVMLFLPAMTATQLNQTLGYRRR